MFHSRVAAVLSAYVANPAGQFFANGYLSVSLFFLLSGFILAYTYEGQILTRSDHRRFWEARFARIWPLYMFSLLFCSLIGEQPYSLPSALAEIFMVQAWNPFHILPLAVCWNVVCWTLSVEAFFYLIFPFVQTWLDRRTTRTIYVFLVAAVLICVLGNTAWHIPRFDPLVGLYQYIPYALVHLPEFLIGVSLGNIFLRRRAAGNLALPGKGWWTWIAAAACIALLARECQASSSLVAPAFAALIFGLAAEPSLLRRFLSTPILMLGGQISYGIYLLQDPTKIALDRCLDYLRINSTPLRLPATFVVLSLLAYICFNLIENPARKALRSMFANIEARGKRLPT